MPREFKAPIIFDDIGRDKLTGSRKEHDDLGSTLYIPDIKQALDAYFINKKITPEQQQELREDFKNRVLALIKRQQRENKQKPSEPMLASIFTNALARLEIRTEQLVNEGEALNPHLLKKPGMSNAFGKKAADLSNPENTENGKRKRVVVLITIDLDDFKTINDKYGHSKGDRTLKSAGRNLSRSIRPGEDEGAHYSGDEFGILLDVEFDEYLDEEEIKKRIEKIIKRIVNNIEKNTERPDNKPQPLSVGYQTITEQTPFKDVLDRTDTAAELSKIIRIIESKRGNDVVSCERIIDVTEIEEIEQKYDKNEIRIGKAIRGMKRELFNAYQELTAEEILDAIYKIIDELETIRKIKVADKKT